MRALGAGLVAFLLAPVPLAAAQSPAAGRPSPEPTPSAVSKHPIADSVGPVVERYLREHAQPCSRAEAERVPCFPVTVEAHAPTVSVAEALRQWRADTSVSARPEWARPGSALVSPYGTPLGGVSFDPICAGKSLLRKAKGGSDTYYLYRVFDQRGEHAVMRDRPLEPGGHTAVTTYGYEFLGKIGGECEAIAAWNKANREAEERNRARAAAKEPAG